MRKINLIICHCTASRPDQHITVEMLDQMHKARGWKGIGYHFYITRDGHLYRGRLEDEIGAHARHYNAHSIGICYEGGLDIRGQPDDTRTAEQKAAMRRLIDELHERYPRALVVGHRDLSHDRDCPCFDAVKAYADLQPK